MNSNILTSANDGTSSIFCELHGSIIYTLRKNLRLRAKPFQRTYEPLRRAKQPLRRAKQPLRRANQSLWRTIEQSLRRSMQLESQKRKLLHSRPVHSSCIKCINSDRCVCKCNYRFSVRSCARKLSQPNMKRFRRDREPSRLPLKRIILAMRKRKNRPLLKRYLLMSAPKSSTLNKLVGNFKEYCFQFMHTQHTFLQSFAYIRPSVNLVQRKHKIRKHSLCNQSINKNSSFLCQYNICENKLLLSGDIELNPGPVKNTNIVLPSNIVLAQRLRRYQLIPCDVGGGGDCFFRAVSHQLYGDPERHLEVRAVGIAYLRDNPQRFIESNTENSLLDYLNTMFF
ncbi:uncharacterized protein LOC114538965 [Dendronephthya gigantea]|uniref:uncharacterized protein LOC114533358 n=1 Tax=Dendronephthya gigantea TaxID=151771 RepID=UPI00106AC982|nr:uncharacterized protein LOC114533358 [Dendronephthya gigantea]XP_028410671.1 uncharacterized protein LOC114533358 [Dendronephthya gigantea]XP_028415607.1 uncharacterized protein LOC114538965 [Dendronephthya gigantea]